MTLLPYTRGKEDETRQLEEVVRTSSGWIFKLCNALMMSKMISPAMLSHEPRQVYFSQYGTHRPTLGRESKSHDESKSITKRQSSSRARAYARTVYRGWAEAHL